MFQVLNRDAMRLVGARGVRSFAFSYLNVVFAIYLSEIGFSTFVIGLVYSVAYTSGALMTAVWGYLSDRLGRKKILMVLACLSIASNLILMVSTEIASILLAVMIINVGAGGSAGGGQGGGTFNPVEQAFLAEHCTPAGRNQVFSINAFVGSVFGSLGALLSGLPQWLQNDGSWGVAASYRPLFGGTALLSFILIFIYRSVQENYTPPASDSAVRGRANASRRLVWGEMFLKITGSFKFSRPSSSFVKKMSILGFVDNMGAAMISPLVAYWFFLRFGVELKAIGLLFFLAYFFSAMSFLAAPIVARHIGVVRTMVFSHLTASLIYLSLPFWPSFFLAALMMVLRSFLAYMDNPLRESFTMAMVRREERGSAAGVTNLARVVPFGISPTLSAYMMQSVSLTLPLVLGGGLQLCHDLTFYYLFRHVHPPEEAKWRKERQRKP